MADNVAVTKRGGRKWVVSGICIFLVVLLLLTFFSNTIMNATIPKVMGVYANRGNLSYTNSATSTIQAETKYEVKGIDGRKVDQVLVYNYQPVRAGETILTLEPLEETEALDNLRDQLTQLEREAAYEARQPNHSGDYTSYIEAIDLAAQQLNAANEALANSSNRDAIIAENQNVINSVSPRIPGLESALDAETATVSNINAQITALETQRASIERQIDTLVTIGVPTPTPMPEGYTYIYDPAIPSPSPAPQQSTERIGQLQEEVMAIDAQIELLNTQLTEAQTRVDNASAALANAQAQVDQAAANIEETRALPSVDEAQSAVNSANRALAQARQSYSDAMVEAGITADRAQDAIEDRNTQMERLREQIAKAEEAALATEIVAPADGFVYSLMVSSGDVLSKDVVYFQIIPENTQYTVSFKFDAKTAQDFYPGMEFTEDANIVDRCILESVRPDEDNPRDSRIVKCRLEGRDIWPGISITVTADKSNATYDHVLPSSAINEDNSGLFVYVIEESKSPLGNKYVVRRVAVSSIEATSGAYSAITAEGIDNCMIVVRSEKPLNNGDRVRLEDFNNSQGN